MSSSPQLVARRSIPKLEKKKKHRTLTTTCAWIFFISSRIHYPACMLRNIRARARGGRSQSRSILKTSRSRICLAAFSPCFSPFIFVRPACPAVRARAPARLEAGTIPCIPSIFLQIFPLPIIRFLFAGLAVRARAPRGAAGGPFRPTPGRDGGAEGRAEGAQGANRRAGGPLF